MFSLWLNCNIFYHGYRFFSARPTIGIWKIPHQDYNKTQTPVYNLKFGKEVTFFEIEIFHTLIGLKNETTFVFLGLIFTIHKRLDIQKLDWIKWILSQCNKIKRSRSPFQVEPSFSFSHSRQRSITARKACMKT